MVQLPCAHLALALGATFIAPHLPTCTSCPVLLTILPVLVKLTPNCVDGSRVSSPQEAAATPCQATHLIRSNLPTPVPKATPMPRANVQQAPAMVHVLTPLAPSMVARRQETGAEAQLARWETGMDLLQRDKEDDVSLLAFRTHTLPSICCKPFAACCS